MCGDINILDPFWFKMCINLKSKSQSLVRMFPVITQCLHTKFRHTHLFTKVSLLCLWLSVALMKCGHQQTYES